MFSRHHRPQTEEEQKTDHSSSGHDMSRLSAWSNDRDAEDTIQFSLKSDLASPSTSESPVYYEVLGNGSKIWSDDSYETDWRVEYSGRVMAQKTSRGLSFRFGPEPNATGNYTIFATVRRGNRVVTILSELRQVVEEREYDDGLPPILSYKDTYRNSLRAAFWELVNDFPLYVKEAARMTGDVGVTERFLAAVLSVEMAARNKIHRERELEKVAGSIDKERNDQSHGLLEKLDRSIGVGQVRLSTAAMLLGYTPWLEQERQNRDGARDDISDNFEGLSTAHKEHIYELLRWPKTNIHYVAQLLSRLKNRSHRFSQIPKSDFANNEDAVKVIATEYNSGPTDTPRGRAGGSRYGQAVWRRMQEPPIKELFSN